MSSTPEDQGARDEGRGASKTPSNLDPRTSSLKGLGVVVTRPIHQADELARRIEAVGGRPILWPALEILPPRDSRALAHLQDRFEQAQIAIFISANAVERASDHVAHWPPALAVGAVGEGTARAIRKHLGREPDLRPEESYDSEGLLALPALHQVGGKRVVIVRGEGGRELLAETLRARGATVEYAEVYRRACPNEAPAAALKALAEGAVDIITVTSPEALRNLLQTAGKFADRLRALPLVVVSERMRREAAELGFLAPALLARSAGTDDLVEALEAWASRRH